MVEEKCLKRDLFGEVRLQDANGEPVIVRDTAPAPWWTRGVARWLLAREARALAALDGIDGVPELLEQRPGYLARSYIAGEPLYRARPRDARWFADAARLLLWEYVKLLAARSRGLLTAGPSAAR